MVSIPMLFMVNSLQRCNDKTGGLMPVDECYYRTQWWIVMGHSRVYIGKSIHRLLSSKEQRMTQEQRWELADIAYYKAHQKRWQNAHPKQVKAIRKDWELAHAEKRKQFGFKSLNKWFEGSEGHHINLIQVIYIPKALHHSIYHSVIRNMNMEAINKLAFNYLNA